MSIKDGLLAITTEVLGDVQKEAEAIILAAENDAKENLKTAKEQADKNYQAIIDEANVKAEADKRKIASVTEVDIRNRLLRTKEDLVGDVFERVFAKLKEFTATEAYHDYLLNVIKEFACKINYKKLVVQVNAKDKTWLTQETLNRLSKRLHLDLKLLEEAGDFIGGCKIQTEGGKITIDSTIDNRLEELKPVLRVEVAKTLFVKEA
jgi:V/A-type H+-transporting ATPase subunit E